MENILLYMIAALSLVNLLVLFFKKGGGAVDSQGQFAALEKSQERLERLVQEEIGRNREELRKNIDGFTNSVLLRLTENSGLQKNQLDTFSNQLSTLTRMNEEKLEKVRDAVEKQLRALQEDNSRKLEQMRATVDEKLQSTLETRLGESFRLVSAQLDKVHQGLGEMQSLASGVGDLKKVLTNVKTRGIWGEVQLGNLLEQILTPDQYAKNIVTKKGSRDPVEFAIKLPGRDSQTMLPIDAKFPLEDYQRLVEAQERADLAMIEEAGKALENRLKLEAKNIRDKYVDPPATTDFGLLFLPVEGLYAEVLRRPGFSDLLQREYRVIITGPTTIAALLNALQMGFRTLAVEKRASEVWTLLGVVKAEFGKFGDILQKTHDKLKQATDNIEEATRKTRTIEQKLKNVQQLPAATVEPLKVIQDTIDENAAVE